MIDSEQVKSRLPCLQISDRVDHPRFGLGTVCEPQKDDRVTVTFDVDWFGTKCIIRKFLTHVTSPDVKGGAYWAHEFQEFLELALLARSRTNAAMKLAFRDKSRLEVSSAHIRAALEREKASMEALLQFLDADEAGEHP